MAKIIIYLGVILLLHGSINSVGAQTCITSTYLKEVGVREATGNNDGKRVEEYLRFSGLGKGYSWCAAFVKWCLARCGVVTPITAWSPTAENRNNLVYKKKFIQQPKPGDVFCLWSSSKGRIAHTGFFHKDVNGSVYETVEGNTSSGGSFNGDGVYIRRRSYKTTHSISRWN